MHDQPSPRSTEREDERTQSAVLSLVLNEHPAQLTICEVSREVAEDEGDSPERAIRDLVGVGLLRCEGASVLPTRAALHFDRLSSE
jgi:hypothetical protein